MRAEPFPDPGEDDNQERDGSLLPTAPSGLFLFLFLCLPAEQFDPGQFEQSGPAADMAPGPMLATNMDLIAGDGGSGLGAIPWALSV